MCAGRQGNVCTNNDVLQTDESCCDLVEALETTVPSEKEACVARRLSEVSGPEALAILMFLTNASRRIAFHVFHA